MPSNRSAPRQRTFLKAEIETIGGVSGLSCAIRDLSETGARLVLSEAVPLPDHFRLHVKGRWVAATLKWRRGEFAGVHFDRETPASAETGQAGVRERLRTLGAENAQLRRMLEEIRADPSRLHQILNPPA